MEDNRLVGSAEVARLRSVHLDDSTVAASVGRHSSIARWLRSRRSAGKGIAERRPVTIGLMDHMGAGNLGDDTTQTAVIENIRKRWPDCVICAFTMNPPDTESRHGIAAYPLRRRTWDRPGQALKEATDSGETPAAARSGSCLARRMFNAAAAILRKPKALVAELAFLARSFATIRRVDVFILSGSGQLLDSWGGPWEYPYTICKWVLLARLSGAKCYFLNVGAGPLNRPLSRFFVRHALRLADYTSFRDEPSRALARAVGFTGRAHVFPDSVYSFDGMQPSARPAEPSGGPIVGLAPMAYCDPRRYYLRDPAAYQDFIRKFATFGSWLAQHHRLIVFSTDVWFDSDTLEDLTMALANEPGSAAGRSLLHMPVTSLASLRTAMVSMDYIVTCRFHGVIFAHLMNIPVVAVSHHPKVTTLMADLGLSEFCLDIDRFDAALLKETFGRMVADRVQIKARMAEYADLYRRKSESQFDRLFPAEWTR